jgi:DnaJ homolog subfamily C member 3
VLESVLINVAKFQILRPSQQSRLEMHLPLQLLFPALTLLPLVSSQSTDWKHQLDEANHLLSQGNYNDAIALYHEVIRAYPPPIRLILETDDKNYLSYYKRALSYLGLSRYHSALEDLNSVLAIQPDFSAALLQRGKILTWQGDFTKAVQDLRHAGHQEEFVFPKSGWG